MSKQASEMSDSAHGAAIEASIPRSKGMNRESAALTTSSLGDASPMIDNQSLGQCAT